MKPPFTVPWSLSLEAIGFCLIALLLVKAVVLLLIIVMSWV